MYIKCVLFFILFLATIINASIFQGNTSHKDYPNKCVFDSQILSEGETKRMREQCCQITCESNSYLMGECCSTFMVPKECKILPVDLSKPYPDCCSYPVCPDKSDNGYISNTIDDEDK